MSDRRRALVTKPDPPSTSKNNRQPITEFDPTSPTATRPRARQTRQTQASRPSAALNRASRRPSTPYAKVGAKPERHCRFVAHAAVSARLPLRVSSPRSSHRQCVARGSLTRHNRPQHRVRDTRAEAKASLGPRVAAHLPFATCGADRDLRSPVADGGRRELPRFPESRARCAETRNFRERVCAPLAAQTWVARISRTCDRPSRPRPVAPTPETRLPR